MVLTNRETDHHSADDSVTDFLKAAGLRRQRLGGGGQGDY
jgi:hypothetical protein